MTTNIVRMILVVTLVVVISVMRMIILNIK